MKNNMNKISFSLGTLSKLTEGYYNLTLLNSSGKIIYKATMSNNEASKVIMKYDNITIKI
jgi:antitoxin component YwqK of YwqJK toxin-antitoxin module